MRWPVGLRRNNAGMGRITGQHQRAAGHGLIQRAGLRQRRGMPASNPKTRAAAVDAPQTAAAFRTALAALADPVRAQHSARYFKTGKGEYGHGDVFAGAKVPQTRAVVRTFRKMPLGEVKKLLRSKVHEERLGALLILVHQSQRGDNAHRQACFDLYMQNLRWVNNWDLVDSSAGQVVGAWLRDSGQSRAVLYKLARSKDLWERRVAMLACSHFIGAKESTDALAIATLLLHDPHDLIHKAVGWMLREVGGRVGLDELRGFLQRHAATMPRTALRYAIEKLAPAERKRWMAMAG
jgi:3-methyladenine DNA glycosylase AlkD